MNLRTNPVLIRELEMRARQPASYTTYRYNGPLQPLALLSVAFLILLIIGSTAPNTPIFYQLPITLYTLYLAYAAARLGAGCIAPDRTYLFSLPVRPSDVFVGKLVGVLLPLWIEVVLMAPLLVIPCLLAGVPMHLFGLVLVFLLGTVLIYGLWGMLWSMFRSDVEEAVQLARRTVHFFIWGIGAFCMLLGIGGLPDAWQPWAALNPLYALHLLLTVATSPEFLHSLSPGTVPLMVGELLVPLVLSLLILRRLRQVGFPCSY